MGTNRLAHPGRLNQIGAIAIAMVLAVSPAARAAESIADLVKLLSHDSVFKRVKAARKLGEMGPDAVEALPALRAALQDPERTVRMTAARAIERIAPQPKEKRSITDLAAEAKRLIDGVTVTWTKFVNDRESVSDEDLKKLIESSIRRSLDL